MEQDIRYPIGRVQIVEYSDEQRLRCLQEIQALPDLLDYAVQNLDEVQLHTPYREGGWTPNQIVHHLADSHMNAFIRFKLTLTEEQPTIKPYDEKQWANTIDVADMPVNVSITLLHALHRRWYKLLASLTKEDLSRTLYHPEQRRTMTLWTMLLIYAWHGKHHATQIINNYEKHSTTGNRPASHPR